MQEHVHTADCGHLNHDTVSAHAQEAAVKIVDQLAALDENLTQDEVDALSNEIVDKIAAETNWTEVIRHMHHDLRLTPGQIALQIGGNELSAGTICRFMKSAGIPHRA